MAKKNTYDPQIDFDATVNEEGKTVRDEINEAIKIGQEQTVNYVNQVSEMLRGDVEQEMLRYVQGIDKSAYAQIINNEKVSKDIVTNFKRDRVFRNIQSADQVQRLQNIFTDHLTVKARRAEIMAKEQAEMSAPLSCAESARTMPPIFKYY